MGSVGGAGWGVGTVAAVGAELCVGAGSEFVPGLAAGADPTPEGAGGGSGPGEPVFLGDGCGGPGAKGIRRGSMLWVPGVVAGGVVAGGVVAGGVAGGVVVDDVGPPPIGSLLVAAPLGAAPASRAAPAREVPASALATGL